LSRFPYGTKKRYWKKIEGQKGNIVWGCKKPELETGGGWGSRLQPNGEPLGWRIDGLTLFTQKRRVGTIKMNSGKSGVLSTNGRW